MKNPITVSVTIPKTLEVVWAAFTEPKHITQWCFATDDWHAPYSENHLYAGGNFLTRMAAKDGSVEFDFVGTYSEVVPLQKIAYTIADQRKVEVHFKQTDTGILVEEIFEPETIHPHPAQKSGWQSILENFKSYVLTM